MADPASYPGVPCWVKVFGIIALVVVLLFIFLHLTGHGPGAHLHGDRSGHDGGQTPLKSGRP